MEEPQERRISPLTVRLEGGVLDGDSFEILPNGSVLPPLRLSYASRAQFVDEFGFLGHKEYPCWLHYECRDKIPEWSDADIKYYYAGKEKMKEDR